GIYYLFRYEEEIFLGRNLREALELTAARTGPGMLIGALTAAGTFFVLVLTDFRGIQELGVIAAMAILLAWVGMMTLFPAVLMLVDRRHADRPRQRRPRALRLQRALLRGLPRRAAAQAGRLREAAVGVRRGLRAPGHPRRSAREDRDHQELRAPGGPDPRRAVEPGRPRPPEKGALGDQAPLRRGGHRGGDQAARRGAGGARQDGGGHPPAGQEQARLRGGRAQLPPGPALPGLRGQVLRAAAQPEPHRGHHQGRARRAAPQVHRPERP